MRIDDGATVSRVVLAIPVGFRFTFNAGLAEACMFRTSVPQLLGRGSHVRRCLPSESAPAAPALPPTLAGANPHTLNSHRYKSLPATRPSAGSSRGSNNDCLTP